MSAEVSFTQYPSPHFSSNGKFPLTTNTTTTAYPSQLPVKGTVKATPPPKKILF
jgi:hypothetical protein